MGQHENKKNCMFLNIGKQTRPDQPNHKLKLRHCFWDQNIEKKTKKHLSCQNRADISLESKVAKSQFFSVHIECLSQKYINKTR
jgi:hypothetical protein